MLNPASTITLSTLRLECQTPAGPSFGTGFLFYFQVEGENGSIAVPVIVTNKHVIDNASSMKTVISLLPQGCKDELEENCTHAGVEHHDLLMENLQQYIVRHPDPGVDLCVVLIGPHTNGLRQTHVLRHAFLDESWIPDAEVRKLLRPIEPIVMIGYPNGLWDKTNNLPIIRNGRTGSHPLLHWNGQQHFIVDAACFPGSSGSPVFLFEDGWYRGTGGYSPGTNIRLLGILYAGPLFEIEGQIIIKAIPTGAGDGVPVISTMMNLGFVIHADALMAIKEVISALLLPQQHVTDV